jgi:hypothetical protein
MENSVRTGTIVMMGAGLLALATGAASAPQYCTRFNNAYLTRILMDQDDCGSHPCGFYANDFSDAQEACGDEVFRVDAPGMPGAATSCDFCYWSNCWTVRKNTFGVTAIDEIAIEPTSPGFRDKALNAPSAQVIFRGGHGVDIDEPPRVYRAVLELNRTYVFWLVQDHTLDEARADATVPVFFSITNANDDGYNHLISLTSEQNDGATVFSWEDLVDGGDNDINDVVFTTQCRFTIRPAPPMTPQGRRGTNLPRTTDPSRDTPSRPVAPQMPRAPSSGR